MTVQRSLRYLLLVSCLTIAAPFVNGQKVDQNTERLTISDYKTVKLVIEDIEPPNSTTLTKEAVQNRAELRMRAAGLKPVSVVGPAPFRYLYINVNLIRSSYGVSVEFYRWAFWETASGKTGSGYVSVWDNSIIGNPPDSGRILNALDGLMDDFLNAYLKANQDDK
jgi:hypothetical protein